MGSEFVQVQTDGGGVACRRCLVADSPWLRMKGLLGRASLPEGEGILLRPASSIHMFFMRFPIDAVFLDRELRIVRVVPDLRPWRLAWKVGAKAVLELTAGSCRRVGLREGDLLSLNAVP